MAVRANDEVVSAAELRDMKRRIRELERLLGKKTMEAEILKEALEVARSKKLSRGCRCCPRMIPNEGGG
jgi:transposase